MDLKTLPVTRRPTMEANNKHSIILKCFARVRNGREVSPSSICCNDIMKALSGTEPGINIIGLQGPSDGVKDVAETVIRRCTRDNMFDKIVTATVTDKPNPEKIQADIGVLLGVEFDPIVAWWRIWNRKGKKRADRLFDKIKEQPTILVVLFDVNKGIDLAQIGIPFASNHLGCKILLTSTDEKVFSQQMNIDKVVKWRRV